MTNKDFPIGSPVIGFKTGGLIPTYVIGYVYEHTTSRADGSERLVIEDQNRHLHLVSPMAVEKASTVKWWSDRLERMTQSDDRIPFDEDVIVERHSSYR
jgi:hypothetical protein